MSATYSEFNTLLLIWL